MNQILGSSPNWSSKWEPRQYRSSRSTPFKTMTSSIEYSQISMDLSSSSNGLKIYKKKIISWNTISPSSLLAKSSTMRALHKQSFLYFWTLPLKFKAVFKNSTNSQKNFLLKTGDSFLVTLSLFVKFTTVLVDLSRLFSRKTNARRKKNQIFTILSVMFLTKATFTSLMASNLDQSLSENTKSLEIGLPLHSSKYKIVSKALERKFGSTY